MTALRELAERWKSMGNLTYYACAVALLEVLDAEGDGGAVGCLTISRFRGSDAMVNHDFDYYGNLPDGSYSLYPHPARSGVVRDEDVDGFIEALKNKGLELIFKEDRPYIRAALEHFAKFRDATEPVPEILPGTHASLSALSIQPRGKQP